MLENDVVRHKGTMHVGAAKRIETKKWKHGNKMQMKLDLHKIRI